MKRILVSAIACILLALPSMAQEETYRPTQNWFPADATAAGSFERFEGVKDAPTPRTVAEAVAALPALPTVEQLCTSQAKEAAIRSTYQPYYMAIEQALMLVEKDHAAIQARMDAVNKKQAQRNQQAVQQYQSNVNAGLMPSQQEMMALYMSGEINENMSDEQMMDVMAGKFAEKWGISKQEYLKIIGMAQSNPKQAEAYMKSNHPQLYNRLYAANSGYSTQDDKEDPRDARFHEINDELDALQEQLSAANNSYGSTDVRIVDQLNAEWLKSDESHQIDAIETALWERVEKWESTLQLNEYGYADVPFPAWWTAERKKENALIDKWNSRAAVRWLKMAQDGEKQIKGIYEKIAALETENEQLGKQGDTENILYLMNKLRFCTFMGQLLLLTRPFNDALLFPCIDRLEETQVYHVGKG